MSLCLWSWHPAPLLHVLHVAPHTAASKGRGTTPSLHRTGASAAPDNRHTQFINGLQVTASEASAGLSLRGNSLTPEQRQEFDHTWGLQSYDLKELLKKRRVLQSQILFFKTSRVREMEIKEISSLRMMRSDKLRGKHIL
jgi:hypothetical protein